MIECDLLISDKLIDIEFAISFMEKKVSEIIANKSSQMIWILEHKHVYTSGASSDINDDVDVIKVNRGGKLTYHGPGQKIIYLMLDLKQIQKSPDIRKFVDDLHNWMIFTFKNLSINCFKSKKGIGLFAFDKNMIERKIISIGIKLKNWVTMHGISININPELKYFQKISPCGLAPSDISSLNTLGYQISEKEFIESCILSFEKTFLCKAKKL